MVPNLFRSLLFICVHSWFTRVNSCFPSLRAFGTMDAWVQGGQLEGLKAKEEEKEKKRKKINMLQRGQKSKGD